MERVFVCDCWCLWIASVFSYKSVCEIKRKPREVCFIENVQGVVFNGRNGEKLKKKIKKSGISVFPPSRNQKSLDPILRTTVSENLLHPFRLSTMLLRSVSTNS